MNLDFQKLFLQAPYSKPTRPQSLMYNVPQSRPCKRAHPVFLSALASVCWYVMWKGQPGFPSKSGKNNTYQEVSVHVKDVNYNK